MEASGRLHPDYTDHHVTDANHPLAISMESDGYDCPLCLEHLYKPASIACGHIFCGRCVTILQKTQNKCPFRCPGNDIKPSPLPQVGRMLEMNDHRIAKIIYREDEVMHLLAKIENLTKMLVDQDKQNKEMLEQMRKQQAPTCCIARLLYYMFPPPALIEPR